MFHRKYRPGTQNAGSELMIQLSRRLVMAATAGVLLAAAAPARADDLLVFAAASTKDALQDIAKAYEAAGKGKVVYSFASSSDLAKQIENGAPASIFISADKKWMDYVQEKNLIVPDSRKDLLGNTLTLIAPKDSGLTADFKAGNVDLAGLIGDSKLAMGDPDSV